MEQVIDRVATGLGNTVAFLADRGILFVLFALLWVGVGVALIVNQGSLDEVWLWVRDLPWFAQGAMWVLLLPVMLGIWVWQTSWAVVVRVILLVGIAGWNLLVLPRPWS